MRRRTSSWVATLPSRFSHDKIHRDPLSSRWHAATLLNHPNICAIYDIEAENGPSSLRSSWSVTLKH